MGSNPIASAVISRFRTKLVSLRGNLFFVPSLYVIAAIAVAFGSLWADAELTLRGVRLPAVVDATVDSARALLSTVAAATITFAAIAFSVSLLMIQQVASQFSSRVLRGFFRDRFSKRVMGIALGTFTYCLFVLRAVRRPTEDAAEAVVPYISVFVAAILGVVTVLAIVAFIHHSAHSMETAQIIGRITSQARRQIAKLCPERNGEREDARMLAKLPSEPSWTARANADGWVQVVDSEKLFEVIPRHGIARLDAGAGMFVARGAPLVTFWPAPSDPERIEAGARRAVRLGRTRTMEQDLSLGIRQLVDIALRALSPGVNDPTTAEEAIVNIGSVLRLLLHREVPDRVLTDGRDRRIFRPHDLNQRDYVRLAFHQLRRAGGDDPAIVSTVIRTLGPLVEDLEDHGLVDRAGWLRHEAEAILATCLAADPHPDDCEQLIRIASRWAFTPPTS